MKLSLFLLILLLSPLKSFSEDGHYDGPVQWNEFRKHVLEEEKAQELKGLSYMISGAVAAVGGTVGYFHSEEIFSQTLFAITSNVGLAAIGVGASYYWAGSETSSFYYALEGSSLSLAQKNEVLQRYLLKQNELRENRRWIRVATHALIAAVNIYSASQSEDEDMRGLFYFLGGANAVLAISYSF
ncbi:hypothetical protein [Bdellovibrio bacteriovorus]|uniref:Uncharacterized protein n=1 Tax=Bdellovibrio bacteriovorus TaxID=959 RepID=A0A161PT41_BDEBC|nr:hypothetical protein [Bdellovibrio bacteriovorus]KYG67926.1 hypothetical protein AZI87_01230 [Bdellovibrio bacteriovorus]